MNLLEVTGLNTYYGDSHILFDVALRVERNEVVALLGRNGGGKSTTLKSLMGVVTPRAGSVVLDGAEIAGRKSHAIAQAGMQLVHEERRIFGSLDVEENLFLFARLERCSDPRATVDRMLELSDLRDRAHDQVGTLSGGNRQRVNIAIGLLAEPDVLLLDEPSAALDPRQRARLWEFILRLAGEGTTVIYATHNIQEADRYASQLIVLADVELLFDGAPRELEQEVGTTGLDFEEAFVEFLHGRGH